MHGGTKLTVFGQGFDHYNICELTVKFGPQLVDPSLYTLDSKGDILFTTPASAIPGSVVVSVSGNS